MKVEDLITHVVTGRAGKLRYPEALRVSPPTVGLFRETWNASELDDRERGDNLLAEWSTGDVATKRVTNIRPRETTVHIGTVGNTVEIPEISPEDNCGDFHSHPSDISPQPDHKNKRGYQPPSIEDALGLAARAADRKIFISFVISRAAIGIEDFFAMVHIRGLSSPDADALRKLKQEKDLRIKRFVFPTDKDEETFLRTIPMDADSSDPFVRAKQRSTVGYGEEMAKLGFEFVTQACAACSFALYRGGALMKRIA